MDRDFVAPLIADAATFYQFGWLFGTSGNLSRRIDADRFVITRSGKHKGSLLPTDFLEMDLDGAVVPPDGRPSAEASIHQAIYRQIDSARAIYHVHDPYAALCSHRDQSLGETTVEDWEMIKGLGIWDRSVAAIPIFDNHSKVEQIAAEVATFLNAPTDVPGVNICHHGIYAWGGDCHEAKRHIETFAYLFRVSWESGRLG